MDRKEAIDKVLAMKLSPGKDAELIIALHTLIPELRESEDERIRKGLVNFLQSPFIKENLTDEKVAPWVAYLEKQKEASKAIEAVDRIDKYIDDHLANAHDMKDSNPDKKYYRGWDDALGEMAGILQDVYSEKENKFAPRVLPCSAAWFEDGEEKQKEQKPVVTHGETYHVDTLGTQQVIAGKMQQKPAWSEEDEKIFERFLGWLQGTMGEKTYSSWLKSVRERFNLQPKQEWSEEDENCLSTVIWCFEKFAEGRATVCIQPGDAKAYLKVIKNWKPDNLKSLRPQPHWEPSGSRISEFKMKLNEFAEAYNLAATDCESDEYKSCDGNLQILINKYFAELLDLARTELFKHDLAIKFMSYLDENRPEGKMCLSNSECEEIEKAFLVGDWEKIKGYFHKYQWKPSEEQMNLLLNIEGKLRADGKPVKATQLAELYEQLKKLM